MGDDVRDAVDAIGAWPTEFDDNDFIGSRSRPGCDHFGLPCVRARAAYDHEHGEVTGRFELRRAYGVDRISCSQQSDGPAALAEQIGEPPTDVETRHVPGRSAFEDGVGA